MKARSDRDVLVIDGATGTELERRGVDISLPLWSARAIVDAPGVLQAVHEAYLEAGAQAITTATFRTHRRTLALEDMGDRARELTHRAVEIARAARDRVNSNALVLGSVAPLEDCYRPERAPREETCEREHAELIDHLIEAGVDGVLIETMGTQREATAGATVAQQRCTDLAAGWMLSLIAHAEGPPGVLLSGEPMIDLIPICHSARAVGVNCLAAPFVLRQVELLRRVLPVATTVLAYANAGYADEAGNWVSTDAVEPEAYADLVGRWVEAGASIVGGCCGTTPQTIAAVSRRLSGG